MVMIHQLLCVINAMKIPVMIFKKEI